MRKLAGAILTLLFILAGAVPAGALFRVSVSVPENTFSTATLLSSPSLSAVARCDELLGPTVDLEWGQSDSSFTDGYNILRATQDGGPYSLIGKVDRGQTTFTDDTVSSGLSLETSTFYYVVVATAGEWTSAYSPQAVADIPLLCVPL